MLNSGALVVSDHQGKHEEHPHAILSTRLGTHSLVSTATISYSCASNMKRQYLPEGLSIAEMHRLHVQQYGPVKA